MTSHGTHNGYVRGCRQDCCTHAHNVYMKLYRMGRRNRIINPTGTHRRIQALLAIGWYHTEISVACGRGKDWSRDLLHRRATVTTRTAIAVAKAYDALSMKLPADSPYRTRGRLKAQRLGYVSPLAWDDIDTDPGPRGVRTRHLDRRYDSRELVDDITVVRILDGEKLPANTAERLEAMRRWLAKGGSARSLCVAQGWQEGRYTPRQDGAA